MAGFNGLAQVWSDWVQGNDAGTGARGKNRGCSRREAPGLAVMPGGRWNGRAQRVGAGVE